MLKRYFADPPTDDVGASLYRRFVDMPFSDCAHLLLFVSLSTSRPPTVEASDLPSIIIIIIMTAGFWALRDAVYGMRMLTTGDSRVGVVKDIRTDATAERGDIA